MAPSAPPAATAPPYQGVGAPAAPASVSYALPTAESVGRPDVVTGTLLVDSVEAFVLFDSGATFSFASLEFASRANLSMQRIAQSVLVNSPGGILSSSTVCPGCVISLDGEDFIANLMVMKLEPFDIILGMDWLHSYRAVISCFWKTVTLQAPAGDSFSGWCPLLFTQCAG